MLTKVNPIKNSQLKKGQIIKSYLSRIGNYTNHTLNKKQKCYKKGNNGHFTVNVQIMINWTLQVNLLSILDKVKSASAENPTHLGL